MNFASLVPIRGFVAMPRAMMPNCVPSPGDYIVKLVCQQQRAGARHILDYRARMRATAS